MDPEEAGPSSSTSPNQIGNLCEHEHLVIKGLDIQQLGCWRLGIQSWLLEAWLKEKHRLMLMGRLIGS